MERDIKITVGEHEGQLYWLPCPRCAAATLHNVIRSAECRESFNEGHITELDDFQIVECQGCKQMSFRKTHSSSEDEWYEEDNGDFGPIVREELYPRRVGNRKELRSIHLLPPTVGRLYRETLSAIANKSNVLAGIGLRALVEAVCKERNASGGNLERRIDNLVTQGVLTADGANILHSLRLIGNKAAHEAAPPKEADLLLALDVVEHLLNSVYLLPKQAASLLQRGSST